MSFRTLWFYSLLFKLVAATLLPLSPDEAYYWVWAQNLQLSYYDHPPMVAWLFKLGSYLDIYESSVRIPAVILGHATLYVLYKIAEPVLNTKKLSWLIWLVLFSPLLGFGSIIITPDLPVLFFYLLSFYFFQQWLLTQNSLNSILLGASLGLGFCAKYHIVLFVPFALFYLLFTRQLRLLLRPTLIFVVVGGLLFSFPVLLWNFQNDFISFKFQIKHGLAKGQWQAYWTYSYIIGQILLIFPIIFLFALRAAKNSKLLLHSVFAFGPLLFFLLSSTRGLVEGNWPIIAYPFIYVLAVSLINSRKIIFLHNFFWSALIVVFVSYLVFPWYKNPPIKLAEIIGLRNAAKYVHEYSPMYGGTYQIASSIWFFSKTPVYKVSQMSRYDFFDTLAASQPQGDTFYVTMNIGSDLPEWVDRTKYLVSEVKKLDEIFQIVKVSKL